MSKFATPQQLQQLASDINELRPTPHKDDAIEQRIVYWHIFRRKQDALNFANHIMMPEGEQLVGGRDRDSIGNIWWIGVQVDSLEKWGSRAAVHKISHGEPENMYEVMP